MTERIAASARPVVYEDRTSEAARDQGHGPVERRAPIEDEDHPRRKPEAIAAAKAANERRRRRFGNRESRFSDVGSDLANTPPRVDESDSNNLTKGLGQIAAEHVVASIEVMNIMNKTGDDKALGLALYRAHKEKPRT